MIGEYDTDWLPRVLTEEEQMQIKTFHKWQMKVSTQNHDSLHGVTVKWPIPINKVEARKALKRSNSLEMIIIKSEKKDLLDDEFESGEDEDKVSMLLNSKARKKSKYMTTESVRKWN